MEGRAAAAHLDVVGCGFCVVGCVLWLASAVPYDTHFVDQPGKQTPPKMMVMKWTPCDSKHG